MIPFEEPAQANADLIRRITARCGAVANDLAFANMYLLQHKYHTQVAVCGDMLFRHYSGNERWNGYAFPCGGGDVETALRRIEEDASRRGIRADFCLLTPKEAECLNTLRPGMYTFSGNAGDSDYLYRQTDLAELPGTAYHRKRNHLSRFFRIHPEWHFSVLSSQNARDALYVAHAWLQNEDSPALLHEYRAICRALQNIDMLQLTGGVLYADGTPVAMSVASLISPQAADVHYEKCIPDMRDAYPLINRETARLLPCTFINREEDLNQPGLRRAKESYRPALLLEKLTAVRRSC